jgi:hypothetical protein
VGSEAKGGAIVLVKRAVAGGGAPHARLNPSIPIDVAIVTGERTFLAYLLRALTGSFAHARGGATGPARPRWNAVAIVPQRLGKMHRRRQPANHLSAKKMLGMGFP